MNGFTFDLYKDKYHYLKIEDLYALVGKLHLKTELLIQEIYDLKVEITKERLDRITAETKEGILKNEVKGLQSYLMAARPGQEL